MCQFFSAIVLRNGDVLWNAYTDSHEDLIQLNDLRDNREGNFARIEFKPDDPKELDKPESYKLKIDEQRDPDWFDDRLKEKTVDKLKSIIKRMIIDKPVTALCGGCYILTKHANVSWVKAARIVVMRENSNVEVMWDSSKVGEMFENSKVGAMWESSKVGVMFENSKVGAMRDNSNVGVMFEGSKVDEMRDNSNVGVMRGNSNVCVMRENSKVGAMRDNSNVEEMWENSKVGAMWDSSKVGVMFENSNVGAMRENSKVVHDQRTKQTEEMK